MFIQVYDYLNHNLFSYIIYFAVRKTLNEETIAHFLRHIAQALKAMVERDIVYACVSLTCLSFISLSLFVLVHSSGIATSSRRTFLSRIPRALNASSLSRRSSSATRPVAPALVCPAPDVRSHACRSSTLCK